MLPSKGGHLHLLVFTSWVDIDGSSRGRNQWRRCDVSLSVMKNKFQLMLLCSGWFGWLVSWLIVFTTERQANLFVETELERTKARRRRLSRNISFITNTKTSSLIHFSAQRRKERPSLTSHPFYLSYFRFELSCVSLSLLSRQSCPCQHDSRGLNELSFRLAARGATQCSDKLPRRRRQTDNRQSHNWFSWAEPGLLKPAVSTVRVQQSKDTKLH